MAILQLEDGTVKSVLSEIVLELAPLGIELKHYDLGEMPLYPHLLNQDVFTEEEKNHIIVTHHHLFEFLQQEKGYMWYELQNIHPGSPVLETLAQGYARYHIHSCAEANYVLAGELLYGFVKPEGQQIHLLIQPQDYIHIDREVEHWSSPSALLNGKILRYFTTVDGWLPGYTGTPLNNSLTRE